MGLQIAGERLLLVADATLKPLAGNLSAWPSNVPANSGTYTVKLELGQHMTDVAIVHATLTGSVSVAVSVSPTTGVHGNPFTVTFGTATAPTGFVFDLQVKAPKGAWVTLENGVTTGSASYTPAAKGKYSFRARLRKSGSTTLASGYSATDVLTVT